jgi:hypothetical protein
MALGERSEQTRALPPRPLRAPGTGMCQRTLCLGLALQILRLEAAMGLRERSVELNRAP